MDEAVKLARRGTRVNAVERRRVGWFVDTMGARGAVQYSTAQQCDAIQYGNVQCSAVQCSTVELYPRIGLRATGRIRLGRSTLTHALSFLGGISQTHLILATAERDSFLHAGRERADPGE